MSDERLSEARLAEFEAMDRDGVPITLVRQELFDLVAEVRSQRARACQSCGGSGTATVTSGTLTGGATLTVEDAMCETCAGSGSALAGEMLQQMRAELARLRPVVEAAREYKSGQRAVVAAATPPVTAERTKAAEEQYKSAHHALLAAVDALEAPAEEACSTCAPPHGDGRGTVVQTTDIPEGPSMVAEPCPACTGGSDG